MIGCYDFCGHYEWTFDWLAREGGETLVREYWVEAISHDSQRHARELILGPGGGFPGMLRYWGHTLEEESPDQGYHITHVPDRLVRFDMSDCPSKGFLLRNGLEQYSDYCDHCIGWVGPLLQEGGFTLDHEHNHRGQCWWEIRRADDPAPASAAGELYGHDARLRADWNPSGTVIDQWQRSVDLDEKNEQKNL